MREGTAQTTCQKLSSNPTHYPPDFYDLLMEEGGEELGTGKDPPSELIEDEVVGKIVDRYEQKEKAEAQLPTDETKKAK